WRWASPSARARRTPVCAPGGRTTTQRFGRPSLVLEGESSTRSNPSTPTKKAIAASYSGTMTATSSSWAMGLESYPSPGHPVLDGTVRRRAVSLRGSRPLSGRERILRRRLPETVVPAEPLRQEAALPEPELAAEGGAAARSPPRPHRLPHRLEGRGRDRRL